METAAWCTDAGRCSPGHNLNNKQQTEPPLCRQMFTLVYFGYWQIPSIQYPASAAPKLGILSILVLKISPSSIVLFRTVEREAGTPQVANSVAQTSVKLFRINGAVSC